MSPDQNVRHFYRTTIAIGSFTTERREFDASHAKSAARLNDAQVPIVHFAQHDGLPYFTALLLINEFNRIAANHKTPMIYHLEPSL